MTRPADPNAPIRWMARGIAAGILVIGWLFVLWQNRFHVTTPVVVVCLAYLAVVAIVFNMYRTGAAAVAENEEDDGGASWGVPIGARSELEREKKALLKAIKEAEFDQMMGKLSKQDAEDMIRTIRARAIEVIKELDRLDAGTTGTVRDRIEREVRARLAIAAVRDKKGAVVDKTKPAETAPAVAETKKDDVRSKKRGKNRGKQAEVEAKAYTPSDANVDAKTDPAPAAANGDPKPDADVTADASAASKPDVVKADDPATADAEDDVGAPPPSEAKREEVRS